MCWRSTGPAAEGNALSVHTAEGARPVQGSHQRIMVPTRRLLTRRVLALASLIAAARRARHGGAQATLEHRDCWCASARVSRSSTHARRTSSASRGPRCRPIDLNNSLVGFARTVESELRIEADSGETCWRSTCRAQSSESQWQGTARTRQEGPRGMHRPESASPPSRWRFFCRRTVRSTNSGSRGNRKREKPDCPADRFRISGSPEHPELIQAPNGREDCFDWVGHIASRGRIWVDAETYDVLRVERGLGDRST